MRHIRKNKKQKNQETNVSQNPEKSEFEKAMNKMGFFKIIKNEGRKK